MRRERGQSKLYTQYVQYTSNERFGRSGVRYSFCVYALDLHELIDNKWSNNGKCILIHFRPNSSYFQVSRNFGYAHRSNIAENASRLAIFRCISVSRNECNRLFFKLQIPRLSLFIAAQIAVRVQLHTNLTVKQSQCSAAQSFIVFTTICTPKAATHIHINSLSLLNRFRFT